jgi:hypothetical protein
MNGSNIGSRAKKSGENSDNATSFRAFVRTVNARGKVGGKVILIQKSWTFEVLLEKLGKKFDMQITDVYLVSNEEHDEARVEFLKF